MIEAIKDSNDHGTMTDVQTRIPSEPPSELLATADNRRPQTENPPCDSLNTDDSTLNTVTAGDPDLPDLIPVRMLNEFTYCARLGYLEWVDGEWASNLETMEGTFGHRRVDQEPKRARRRTAGDLPQAAPPGSTEDAEELLSIHSRSLMLSAPQEGLLSKLDLLELDGMVATPVDYKRGKAPAIPEGAYEPERVQLCAQGLILRENGFQCDRGVLYFIGSKKRVTIEFTEELIERTRQLRNEFRRTASAGILPPPLVDSPKCPRCSLVGICLPDETNLLRYAQTTEYSEYDDAEASVGIQATDSLTEPTSQLAQRGLQPAVRRLIPADDDALPLYVQTQGAMVGKSGDRLTIKLKDELLAERRLMDVSQVSLFGSVIFSAQALRELTVRGIPVCHFTYGGWFHGITTGLVHKNVQLRIRQFEIAADAGQSLQIARCLISGKIRNARTMLRRHLSGGTAETGQPTDEPESGMDAPPSESRSGADPLAALAEYRRRAERASSAETLLGLEGMAAKIYFEHFFELLNRRHDFDVNDRNRRPPRDPVNAVLSFVYSLLVKELTVVLQAVGFDPMLGFFHRPRYGRPGLALDLAEEYRPLIGDSVTLMVFNNGEVDHTSFLERMGSVTLTEQGRKSVIAAFERRLEQEVTHPTFGYRISYRRILEVQARLLARTVTGELPEYVPFCTR